MSHKDLIASFPFALEFTDSKPFRNISEDQSDLSSSGFRVAKFRLKTNKHLRNSDFESNRNKFYQFNLTVSDQGLLNDSAIVQVVFINKQQRVKLVFAQSLEKVRAIQEEFREYINNLTGLITIIDKLSIHREETQSSNLEPILTDMYLHFVGNSNRLFDLDENKSSIKVNHDYIAPADLILTKLDKSRDLTLLRKYRLTLAEKLDDQGQSTFYKYGAEFEDDSLFWSSKSHINLFFRLVLSFFCVLLLTSSIFILIICCCMRRKYKRKIKKERAVAKAFGFDQKSINYADAISGYVNSAFDSNSLMPIPGTNLYSYEGSNPIWLKKYDQVDALITARSDKDKTEISSFYLKQNDELTPTTSRSSPSQSDSSNEKNNCQNATITSEILSIKDVSPQSLNPFNNFETLLTFASNSNNITQIKTELNLRQNQKSAFLAKQEQNVSNSLLFPNSITYTKIFDNSPGNIQRQQQTNSVKDYSDLYAVESTVI